MEKSEACTTQHQRTALFRRFKAAVDTLTLESSRRTSRERVAAIEFLSCGRNNTDVLMIFSGILRRFRAALSEEEKIKIAEIITDHRQAPPLLRESVSSTLMKALEIESAPSVQNAYRGAVAALSFED
jgi:hypothetical protein